MSRYFTLLYITESTQTYFYFIFSYFIWLTPPIFWKSPIRSKCDVFLYVRDTHDIVWILSFVCISEETSLCMRMSRYSIWKFVRLGLCCGYCLIFAPFYLNFRVSVLLGTEKIVKVILLKLWKVVELNIPWAVLFGQTK